jgi:hypothetical protein
MASVVIRKAWFSRPSVGVLATVPASFANASAQVSEAAWLASLAPWLNPGTRSTSAAGGATVGNVVSSNPAGLTTQAAGTAPAYVVRV